MAVFMEVGPLAEKRLGMGPTWSRQCFVIGHVHIKPVGELSSCT